MIFFLSIRLNFSTRILDAQACVAGSKREGGGRREKVPLLFSLLSLPPYPLLLSTLATQDRMHLPPGRGYF